jgi:hypothetical protein
MLQNRFAQTDTSGELDGNLVLDRICEGKQSVDLIDYSLLFRQRRNWHGEITQDSQIDVLLSGCGSEPIKIVLRCP